MSRPTRRGAHWQVAKTTSGQYVLRLVGGNGEIVLVSETHPDRRDALHALTVVDEAQTARVVDDHGSLIDEPDPEPVNRARLEPDPGGGA